VADPQKYRDEAERLRREAEDSLDPDMRRTLLDIAGLYERMADALAKQHRDPIGLSRKRNQGRRTIRTDDR